MKLPGAERAVIDDGKIRDYLLSPEHPVSRAKARFFAQLGFDRQRWTDLKNELQRFASLDAHPTIATRFGQKYVVRSTIQGSRGRLASVVVVRIVLHGEDFPRFVTAYPGAKS